MLDVLTLYKRTTGIDPTRTGAEWHGPCPDCGGRDRFVILPDPRNGAAGGMYFCRQCGKKGGATQFLRDFEGMTYADACREAGVPVAERTAPHFAKKTGPQPAAEKTNWTASAAIWASAAEAFLEGCDATCAEFLDALKARFLTPETARTWDIVWNASDRYDKASEWGIPTPEGAAPRKLYLPRGLVLPVRRGGRVVSLRIRRADYKDGDKLPKYWQVRGGADVPFAAGRRGLPCVVVESQLDAVLVWQDGGDMAAAVALNGATKRPDSACSAYLHAVPLVLVALDFDEAGFGAWDWWRRAYPQAVPLPPLRAKDVADMVKAGMSVRAWLTAGLRKYLPPPADATREKKTLSDARRATEEAYHGQNLTDEQNVPCEGSARTDWDAAVRVAGRDEDVEALLRIGVTPCLDDCGHLDLRGFALLDPETKAYLLQWLDGARQERIEALLLRDEESRDEESQDPPPAAL